MSDVGGFTIFPNTPSPEPSEIEQLELYIYSTGFLSKKAKPELLILFMLGKMPFYDLHANHLTKTLHLVEHDYRMYRIKLIPSGWTYDYSDSCTAYEKYIALCNNNPSTLTEIYTQTWDRKTINYQWHKKFKYGKPYELRGPEVSVVFCRGKHPYADYIQRKRRKNLVVITT